jgi:hypothetical protein
VKAVHVLDTSLRDALEKQSTQSSQVSKAEALFPHNSIQPSNSAYPTSLHFQNPTFIGLKPQIRKVAFSALPDNRRPIRPVF